MKLGKPTLIYSIFSFLNTLVAFIRDIFLAAFLGTGVLADISKIISSNESNIQDVKTKTLDENFIELAIKINVKDLSHLSLIQSQLKRNKTVTSIDRQLT